MACLWRRADTFLSCIPKEFRRKPTIGRNDWHVAFRTDDVEVVVTAGGALASGRICLKTIHNPKCFVVQG